MNQKTCRGGIATMVVAVAVMACGCVKGKEFRTIAGPSIQSGVSLILDGFVQGVFAVVEPDPVTGGTGNDSSTSNP